MLAAEQGPGKLPPKIFGIYVRLLAANLAAWVWALAAFYAYPVVLGTAFLACTFGLRHAFDADHIAAIDNVTRKLLQQGNRPVAVGLFFSLRRSTIVTGLSIAIALTTSVLQSRFDMVKSVGCVVGTLVSAVFLFVIAGANPGRRAVVEHVPAGPAVRAWIRHRDGSGSAGISATQAAQGMSAFTILIFPALFPAGMTLMDTTDSILMSAAYGWASQSPSASYYNLTMTALSVLVALIVGGLEMIGDHLDLTEGGGFWGAVGVLSDNFGILGYVIVGIFVAAG